MNAVVQYDPSVPAFLRNANFLALNQKAAAGLSTGAPPRLSFRGSRFRFVSADGTETPLPAEGAPGNNSITVDVIVVDASDHVSKFYYDKAYDPNSDDLSPACFSDNGQGPSNRAARPQSLLCAGCPKNAWGSKVTPQGTQVKACNDVKKLAIVPISNVDGPVFMLGIPGASLKTWNTVVDFLNKRGAPVGGMVIRLGFDPEPAFPKLTFSPYRYLIEQEVAAISDLFGSDECNELVGRKDTAITAMPNGPQTAAPVAQPIVMPQPAPPPPVFTAPQQEPIPAFLDRTGGVASQPFPTPTAAPQAAPEAEAPRRRRGRPPAAETAPQAPQAPAAPVFTQPTAAPAGGPQDLNAMLDAVMKAKG